MKTYDICRLPSMLCIGYDGENNWRPQSFDCTPLLENHPNGTITLWLLPDGETQAFPVALTRDGNTVVWTPLSEEMTARTGALQIVCTDGTDVGKSRVALFRVDSSILPGAEHPAAVPSWATQTVERAEDAADRAEAAAESIDIEALEARIAEVVADYLDEHPVEAPVQSVNGQTGEVDLDASDVGALPDDTPIPAEVTEQTVSGWGFTKNTGTYSKPSGGIPASDLAQAVQTSLGKADTAVLYNSQTLTDAQKAQARQNIDAASIADLGTVFTLKGGVATVNDLPQTGNSIGDVWYVESVSAGFIWITSTAYPNGYWEELGETIDMSAYQTKTITDTGGYYTTDTVDGALQEIGAELAGINTLIGSGVIT